MSKSHKTRGITTITGIGRKLFAGLQGGDTLIEVVVAMLLLGLMILETGTAVYLGSFT